MSEFDYTDDVDNITSLDAARDAAIARYPGAAPLREMLVGATAAEVVDAAKQVSEALARAGHNPAPEAPQPTREERRLTAEQQEFRNRRGDTLRDKLNAGGWHDTSTAAARMVVKYADNWCNTEGHLNEAQIHDLRSAAQLADMAGDKEALARYNARLRRSV